MEGISASQEGSAEVYPRFPELGCNEKLALDRTRMAADCCDHGRHIFVVRRRRRRRVGRIFGAPTRQEP